MSTVKRSCAPGNKFLFILQAINTTRKNHTSTCTCMCRLFVSYLLPSSDSLYYDLNGSGGLAGAGWSVDDGDVEPAQGQQHSPALTGVQGGVQEPEARAGGRLEGVGVEGGGWRVEGVWGCGGVGVWGCGG